MTSNLQEAIAAVRSGDNQRAQLIAIDIVRDNPDDANGWYLLSQLVDSDARRAAYLSKTLALDPDHARARLEFDALPPALAADLAPAAMVTASPPKEVAAEAIEAAAAPRELDPDIAEQLEPDHIPEWLQGFEAQTVPAARPVAEPEAAPVTAPAPARPRPAPAARPPQAKKTAAKKKKNSGNQALSIMFGLLALLTIIVLAFLVYLLLS